MKNVKFSIVEKAPITSTEASSTSTATTSIYYIYTRYNIHIFDKFINGFVDINIQR